MKPVVVAEPPKRVLPATENTYEGEVVPMPTNPLPPSTMNIGVEVPWSPTTKIGVEELLNPWMASTERSPQGVVDATPIVEVEVSVPRARWLAVEEPKETKPAVN
jgi:hypothetical protein